MSKRGKALFDRYVKLISKHEELQFQRMEHYIDGLATEAEDAGVPMSEIIEEVGDLQAALFRGLRKTNKGK